MTRHANYKAMMEKLEDARNDLDSALAAYRYVANELIFLNHGLGDERWERDKKELRKLLRRLIKRTERLLDFDPDPWNLGANAYDVRLLLEALE